MNDKINALMLKWYKLHEETHEWNIEKEVKSYEEAEEYKLDYRKVYTHPSSNLNIYITPLKERSDINEYNF